MEDRHQIVPIAIESGMKEAYVDYAMSVIVARALPDVRDGFKPVHRRILYTMFEERITPDKKFRKSASAVGNVLARYHPHGDASVYDAMVRLAQPFNMRYPLVAPQGNFGSVDGDPPAHMRYTEAKLAPISMEMIRDLGKDTVDWRPNFDNSTKEPVVLPALLPNLLLNGSEGIAVGMATKIPPHNLGEVVNGVLAYLEDESITSEGLMEYIPGPDFPTGAIICGQSGIKDAYTTGKGSIKVRSVTSVEEVRPGKQAIIVTEIPFQVNKARLVEEIATKVNSGVITGITDLRDESSRKGMRIVIELANNASAKVVLNRLLNHTRLQCNYGATLLALVNDVPKVLTLRDIVANYVAHRREVVARRTQYELDKALARDHIVQAILKSLEHIDEIIEIIENSADADSAEVLLRERYDFTQIQARAILEMRLQRLTGFEYEKFSQEHAELLKNIDYCRSLLADEHKLDGVIREELLKLRARYGDMRRTAIMASEGENINMEDMISNDQMVVTLSNKGYIKMVSLSEYRAQARGGRGRNGLKLRDGDSLNQLFTCKNHDNLLFFSNKARVYKLKVYELPNSKRVSMGTALVNLLNLSADEKIVVVIPMLATTKEGSIITVTRRGYVKRTALSEYASVPSKGKKALRVMEGDELFTAFYSTSGLIQSGQGDMFPKDSSVFLISANGKVLRFNESSVTLQGRASLGVKTINLKEGDNIAGVGSDTHGKQLFIVTKNGFGKRMNLSEFIVKGRRGMGVVGINVTKKTGPVVAAIVIDPEDQLMISTKNGVVMRMAVKGIRTLRRPSSGVKVINVGEGDEVSGLAYVVDKDIEDDEPNIDEEELLISAGSAEDDEDVVSIEDTYDDFYENLEDPSGI